VRHHRFAAAFINSLQDFPLDRLFADHNSRTTFDVTGDDAAEPIDAVQASASLFATLAVSPHIGRTFTIADESVGAPKVAVLSFDFWHRRYAGNPQVLGKALRLTSRSTR
jgi:hypothetical protein